MGDVKIKPGIVNNYTIKPKNLTQYAAFRGVTDFTQIGQFNPFETGYSFLSVIAMPRFMDELAANDDNIKVLRNNFKHILEYEFKGLSGLPSIEASPGTISDGINDLQYINMVKMDTSAQISMDVVEKSGSPVTKFLELYLTGIKDRMTQAKTYHGLIEQNVLEPGLENEVFTFLYYVTDNTMRRLERAVLLCNCQPTSAPLGDLYNSTKGNIDSVNISISFNCFPVYGLEVDKAAKSLLEDIVGTVATYDPNNKYKTTFRENTTPMYKDGDTDTQGAVFHKAWLDSNDYRYGIMLPKSDDSNGVVNGAVASAATYNDILPNAIARTEANANIPKV